MEGKDPFVRIAWAIGINIFLVLGVVLGTGNDLAQSQATIIVASMCIFGIVLGLLDYFATARIAEANTKKKRR